MVKDGKNKGNRTNNSGSNFFDDISEDYGKDSGKVEDKKSKGVTRGEEAESKGSETKMKRDDRNKNEGKERKQKPKKKGKVVGIVILILLIIFGAVIGGYWYYTNQKEEYKEGQRIEFEKDSEDLDRGEEVVLGGLKFKLVEAMFVPDRNKENPDVAHVAKFVFKIDNNTSSEIEVNRVLKFFDSDGKELKRYEIKDEEKTDNIGAESSKEVTEYFEAPDFGVYQVEVKNPLNNLKAEKYSVVLP